MDDLTSGAGRTGGLAHHPLREQLSNELHTRPYKRLPTPVRVSHLALVTGEGGRDASRAHVAALCERLGAGQPGEGASHHEADFGAFSLKWEQHTEFYGLTLFRPGMSDDPFRDNAVSAVPSDWMADLPGWLMVAAHVAVGERSDDRRSPDELLRAFGSDQYVASAVSDGAATVWTDFRLHAGGWIRLVVDDHGLDDRRAGRLIQRLLEIETYRMMALLAFPIARGLAPKLGEQERRLAEIMTRLGSSKEDGGPEDRALLDELSRISSEVERQVAETSFRFGAANAYARLVKARITELREKRVGGFQTIGAFFARRLTPAVDTCEAMARRQFALSERLSRATGLLRTRIDVELEAQNRDLLTSMNERADMQLRLQETVEGLSVVAISYYSIGIVNYALEGAESAGMLPLDLGFVMLGSGFLTGLSVPFVLAGVWFMGKRLRARLMGNRSRP